MLFMLLVWAYPYRVCIISGEEGLWLGSHNIITLRYRRLPFGLVQILQRISILIFIVWVAFFSAPSDTSIVVLFINLH